MSKLRTTPSKTGKTGGSSQLRSALAEIGAKRRALHHPTPVRLDPLSVRLDDAAAYIGISPRGMRTLVTEKKVPSFMIEGCRVVHWEHLKAYVDRQAGFPAPSPADPAKEAQ